MNRHACKSKHFTGMRGHMQRCRFWSSPHFEVGIGLFIMMCLMCVPVLMYNNVYEVDKSRMFRSVSKSVANIVLSQNTSQLRKYTVVVDELKNQQVIKKLREVNSSDLTAALQLDVNTLIYKNTKYLHQKAVLIEMQTRFTWEESIIYNNTCRPEIRRHYHQSYEPSSGQAIPNKILSSTRHTLTLNELFCPVPCSSELSNIIKSYPHISVQNSMENINMCVHGDAKKICMGVHAKSDIYLQYFSWHDINFFKIPSKVKAIDFFCSFVSNCVTGRLDFLRSMTTKLQDAHKTVHNYGSCANNANTRTDKYKNLEKYKQKSSIALEHLYTFAFENSEKEGYVTEKMFYLLADGGVPVYRGAPDIRKYIPSSDSAVIVRSTDTAEQVVQALLLENQSSYEKRSAWKTQKPNIAWVSRIDLGIWHSNCRLCVRIQSILTPPPTSGLWIRERGFLQHIQVPNKWKSETITIEEIFLSWVDILDNELTKHEKTMKIMGGVSVLEIYRTWDIHKCRIDSLLGLQELSEGTEIEVVLENPHWTRRKFHGS